MGEEAPFVEIGEKIAQRRGLLRPDLLLKVERCGVGRVLGERVAKHLAGFREPARLDETTGEGDAEIVRVRRADASPEELDRRIGVPKLPRRTAKRTAATALTMRTINTSAPAHAWRCHSS